MAETDTIFPYFGSKWSASRFYPTPGKRIVELFAGSACYSCRYPNREVVLVDRDPVIARLWKWLIEAPVEEIRALPDIAIGQTVYDLNIRPEARWLIGFCIHPGGTYPANKLSGWGAKNPAKVWGKTKREGIAKKLANIRHWRVVEGEWEAGIDNEISTWFVDPPYQASKTKYKYHDIDYEKLAATCRKLRGNVIACEIGGTWLPFKPLFDASHVDGKRRVESVWYSTDEAAAEKPARMRAVR